MSRHTPGPWHVGQQNLALINIEHHNDQPGAISKTLAKVVARSMWQAEAEANAILIAAAPDLLAALIEATRIIESEWPGQFEPGQAAIAKATGGAA